MKSVVFAFVEQPFLWASIGIALALIGKLALRPRRKAEAPADQD